MPAANEIRNVIKEPTFAYIKGQIITKPVIVDNNDWHLRILILRVKYTTCFWQIYRDKTETGWVKTTGKVKILHKRRDEQK
jgi:hypothetical protein